MAEQPGAAAAGGARLDSAATAGAMLRAARQAQGMHLAALAASTKVPQNKLEALEEDRLDALPDNTFARALAKTVCRALKIDPAPVLAKMPDLGDQGLDKVHQGLNTTFRERADRETPTRLGILRRPAIWLPLLIVLAAAFVYFMPQQWTVKTRAPADPVSAPGAAAAPAAAPAEAPIDATPAPVAVTPAPMVAAEAASAPAAAAASATVAAEAADAAPQSLLEFKASAETWIEVLDASGAVLLRRKLEPGEFVGLDGTPPFQLKIGNAIATELSFRGKPVDLKPATRDNVARLDLK